MLTGAIVIFVLAIAMYGIGAAARSSWEPKKKIALKPDEETRRVELETKQRTPDGLTPHEADELDKLTKQRDYYIDPNPPQPPGWHTLVKGIGFVLFVFCLVLMGFWLKDRDNRIGEMQGEIKVSFQDIATKFENQNLELSLKAATAKRIAEEAQSLITNIESRVSTAVRKADETSAKATEAESRIAEALEIVKQAERMASLANERINTLEVAQAQNQQSIQKIEGNVAQNFEKINAQAARIDAQEKKVSALALDYRKLASTNAGFAAALEQMKNFESRMASSVPARIEPHRSSVDLDVTLSTPQGTGRPAQPSASMSVAEHLLRNPPPSSWVEQTNPSIVYTNGQKVIFTYVGYARVGQGFFNGPRRIVSMKYVTEFVVLGDVPAGTAQSLIDGLNLEFHNEQGSPWAEEFLNGTEVIVKQAFEAKFRPFIEKGLKERMLDDKLQYLTTTVSISRFKQ